MKETLKKVAIEALSHAYSPYSGIKIGAGILDTKGEIYSGANVENASFGLTVCAERNAVFAAISHGASTLKAMVVVTDSEKVKSPCGACRQVLYEFNPEMEIDFYGPEGYHRHFVAKDLLPEGFEL